MTRAAFRWGVLGLAVLAWVRCFGDAQLEEFGWQFRLLEVWALTASAIAAVLMVRLSMGWSASRHEALAGGVAAVNGVVLLLHLGPLGLFVGGLPPWHALLVGALVPLLQIADALLILRAFDRVRGAAIWATGTAIAYVAWIELAVRPLNRPIEGPGGLPYPALDALGAPSRLAVYAAATGAGLALLPCLAQLQRRLSAGIDREGGIAV